MLDVDLTPGNYYSKNEIEKIFDTKFGYGIKGITLRRWHDNTPYTIIFSRSNGPYSDSFNGNVFSYDGEGLNQDQKLTVANKAIIESNKNNRIILIF